MVWGCFSFHGLGRLVFIDPPLSSIDYQLILVQNLISSSQLMGLRSFIFQQDNAPIHKSKRIKEYFLENNIEVLPWPPLSPGLNPIRAANKSNSNI